MNDPKRQEIKDRIASGQQRQQERASGIGTGISTATGTHPAATGNADQAGEGSGFVGFAKDHPLLTVASGLAVGVLVAGLFPSARGAARKGGAKASALGVAGTQVAMSAFQHLLDSAAEAGQVGGEKLTDLRDTISDTARNTRRDAFYMADRSGDTAKAAARDAGKTFSRSVRRFWS